MPVIATIAATTAVAQNSLGPLLVYCFVTIATFFNLYALYKNYIKPKQSQDPDINAARRDRLHREEQISADISLTAAQLQNDSKAVVDHFQHQSEKFAHIIADFEQTMVQFQNSTHTLEQSNQTIPDIIAKISLFLESMKMQYNQFCKDVDFLSKTLVTTNHTITQHEHEIGTLVGQLQQLEADTQENVTTLNRLAHKLSHGKDANDRLQRYKKENEALKEANQELFSDINKLLIEHQKQKAMIDQLLSERKDQENHENVGQNNKRPTSPSLRLF
ncbi:MAG: hypothetical protein CK424_06525 [Legionella sp.]|nr:MAG: hypothetical protein CK424_06525 [Legionella sp.]